MNQLILISKQNAQNADIQANAVDDISVRYERHFGSWLHRESADSQRKTARFILIGSLQGRLWQLTYLELTSLTPERLDSINARGIDYSVLCTLCESQHSNTTTTNVCPIFKVQCIINACSCYSVKQRSLR